MKNKKRTVCVMVCLCCLLGTVLGAQNRVFTAQEADVKVAIDGVPVAFESPMLLLQGRTYVPLRELCDQLDILVEWSPKMRTIDLETQNNKPVPPEQDWLDRGTLKNGLKYLYVRERYYNWEREVQDLRLQLVSSNERKLPNGVPTAREAAEIWAEENAGYFKSGIDSNTFYLWIDFDKKLDCWVIRRSYLKDGSFSKQYERFVVDRATGSTKVYS